MATNKTLQPTNQQITIAAFSGEKPDHRQIADAETKLADAINALNSKLGKMTVHGVTTSDNNVATITAIKNGEYILLLYAGHMTSIFLGGYSTSIFIGGDDPADYGFTLARNDTVFTLTRTNGNGFQYAWLEIVN